MLPDTIALIVLENLKLLNWQLANLPPEQRAAAAVRFDAVWRS